MLILLLLYLIALFSTSTSSNHVEGPRFLNPPNFGYLHFSNQTGTSIHCTASGSPPVSVYWIVTDFNGNSISLKNQLSVQRLYIRKPLSNGTVIFPPFNSSQYRHDVHLATYRCVAKNDFGIILSQPLHLRAVIDQHFEISVFDEFVIRGNTAVFRCQIPSVMTKYLKVNSWIINEDSEITENSDKYSIFASGEFHIRNIDILDSQYRYRCKVKHLLTNVTRVSESYASIILSEPSNSISPRITDSKSTLSVEEGSSFVEIPCSAEAWPLPKYRWYKTDNLKSSLSRMLLSSIYSPDAVYEMRGGSLILRNIDFQDSGKYVCIASNSLGQATVETELKVWKKLKVKISLDIMIVNTNERALINCSISGYPKEKITWFHNGQPIQSNEHNRRVKYLGSYSILSINSISFKDIGMYQCLVENQNGDSDQDSIQLVLGDTSPRLIEVFDSKVVSIGDKVLLKCSATGIPLPMVTWTLDGQSLDDIKNDPGESRNLRQAMWGDYVVFGKNQVISHVNLTIESVYDGGHYQCKATNKKGEAKHESIIQVNGETRLRKMKNKVATATQSILLDCWLLSVQRLSIKWQKDGRDIPYNHRQLLHKNGSLEIINLNKLIDSGVYTCLVSFDHDNQVKEIKGNVTLKVLNPPVIQDFKFDSKLMAGMRTRIYCSIAQGDLPLVIEWLKDGHFLNNSNLDGIKIKELDQYSHSLMIEDLSSDHNGNYTCKASNEASSVQHTAQLLVNVPPSWSIEPKDKTVTQGQSVIIDCVANGYPIPLITWKYLQNDENNSSEITTASHYKLIRSGPHYQVYENGTLRISNTRITDKGTYLCQASNGIGSGLSKIIQLKINIPVYFESGKLINLTAIKGESIEIVCEAFGDQPIVIVWSKSGQDIEPGKDLRYTFQESVTEKGTIAKLKIRSTLRLDSTLFKCKASNLFDKAVKLFSLKVQEAPEAPLHLKLESRTSRSVAISWKTGYAKIPVDRYLIKIKKLNDYKSDEKNVTIFGNYSTALIQNLSPCSNYSLIVYAINKIGASEPSDPIEVDTAQEAPSNPPSSIRAVAINASAIKVDWNPPKAEHSNRQIQGYYVGYRLFNTSDHFLYKTVSAHPNFYDTDYSVYLLSLLPFTEYVIILQAFNSVGAGPRSDEIFLKTAEGVPSSSPVNIQCKTLTSTSIKITWTHIPFEKINGHLRGYKVRYGLITNMYKKVNKLDQTRDISSELTLYNLEKFSNYSISVAGFTSIGDGLYSDLIYCMTNEDVPSAPAEVKVAISSPESMYVSWRKPFQANGVIQSYTLYRQSADNGAIFTNTVASDRYSHKVTKLKAGQVYNFWVTASTGAGEGASSAIISKVSSSTAPAKIINFSETVEAIESSSLEMACYAVGIPNPSYEWYFNEIKILNYSNQIDQKAAINGTLKVTALKESGNYSCHASNMYGSDFITYHIVVKMKKNLSNLLLPPEIQILSTTNNSILFTWLTKSDGDYEHFIIAQEVFFKEMNSMGYWKQVTIEKQNFYQSNYTINNLTCGKIYQLYMITVSRYGKSKSSDIVQVKIKGREPVASKPFDIFDRVNLTCLSVNLISWNDGGCSLIETQLKWRKFNSNIWNIININSNRDRVFINNLDPSTVYKVRISMTNSAGTTSNDYDVRTSPYSVYSLPHNLINRQKNSVSSNYSNHGEPNLTASIFFTFFLFFILLLIIIFSLFLFNKRIRKRIIGNGTLATVVSQVDGESKFDQKSTDQKEFETELAELATIKSTLNHSKSKPFNINSATINLSIEENPYQHLTNTSRCRMNRSNEIYSPLWPKNKPDQVQQGCSLYPKCSQYECSVPKVSLFNYSKEHTLPKEKMSSTLSSLPTHSSNKVRLLQNRFHSLNRATPKCLYYSMNDTTCNHSEQCPVELIRLEPSNKPF